MKIEKVPISSRMYWGFRDRLQRFLRPWRKSPDLDRKADITTLPARAVAASKHLMTARYLLLQQLIEAEAKGNGDEVVALVDMVATTNHALSRSGIWALNFDPRTPADLREEINGRMGLAVPISISTTTSIPARRQSREGTAA